MNPQPKVIFRIGDMVRIKAGPFAAFTGRVAGINQSRSLLKVAVEIYGRVTPVKLNFSEVETLAFERLDPPRLPRN
jgi:transcriptional antiterminator NusG